MGNNGEVFLKVNFFKLHLQDVNMFSVLILSDFLLVEDGKAANERQEWLWQWVQSSIQSEQSPRAVAGWGCSPASPTKHFIAWQERPFSPTLVSERTWHCPSVAWKLLLWKPQQFTATNVYLYHSNLYFLLSFVHVFYWNDTLWRFICVVLRVCSSPQLQALLGNFQCQDFYDKIEIKSKANT